MFMQQKAEVLNAALEIKQNRLVSLSGGNVSMRMDDGLFLVTPSGMRYENMTPDDIVVINGEGVVVEGNRVPSSDTPALLYMYEHMPHINAIIHTHQPYGTALGFVENEIPLCMVTLIDAAHAPIPVAPFTPSSDRQMGVLTVEYATNALAVILRGHGVMAFGPTLDDALYSAVYLEEAAQTYLFARMFGPIAPLPDEDIAKEAAGWLHYGQK